MVGGIGNTSYDNHLYQSLSSGSRINTAADDAAGNSIAVKTQSQINTNDAQAENISAEQSAANIKDGAYAGISDYLQRIRELGVKAGNGLNGDEEKAAIQQEIDQLKKGIEDTVSQATYNEKQTIEGLDLSSIRNFDVTGDFDLKDIDKALDTVSAAASENGAQVNGLDHAYSYNKLASYNSTAALSTLKDTEVGDYVGKLQQQQTLNTYQTMMQKKKQEEEAARHGMLLTSM